MQRKRVGADGAERLGKITVLQDLPLGQRRELARLVDEITAPAGTTIMSQGEPGYEVVMLEQGTADVIKDGERINVIGPGDLIGELAVISDGVPRTASVVATSDVSAIILTGHFMREMHRLMPSVGEQIDILAAARLERDAARDAG